MDRGVACCVAAVFVVLSVVAPAAAATAPTPAAAGSTSTPDEAIGMPQEFDPDSVSLAAALQADGDADWQFTYRMRLASENETQAFEELQNDVRANTSEYLSEFRSRITETVGAAENATGRNMSVANVSISTRVNSLNEDSLGVVTYSFEWRGFASLDGEQVVAGDALEGFYLDNETSLTISWPESFGLTDVDPEANAPRENAVQWEGPLEFGADQPHVVVEPASNETTTGGPADDPNEGTGDAGSTSTLVIPAMVGAVVAVLVLGVGAWVYRNRSDENGGPVPPASGGDTGGGGSGVTADAGDGSGAGTEATDGSADAAATGESSGNGGEPPAELLSNAERVVQFLESQGGRAKQQAVVEEMGWTEAKTSQVVKDMREGGDLESFRIGRENVLKLPEAEDLDE